MDISQKIKELRKKRGLSAKALGEHLGVSGDNIYAYEKGRAIPPLPKIELLAKVFELEVEYFVSDNKNNITNQKEETNLLAKLKEELNNFKYILIGRYGEKDWSELEKFFPKDKVYPSFSGVLF